MSEKEELKPDKKYLKTKFKELRTKRGGVFYPGGFPVRFQGELVLLDVETQERYIDTLERSIKSQDKLAKTQILLAIVSAVLALIEIVVAYLIFVATS